MVVSSKVKCKKKEREENIRVWLRDVWFSKKIGKIDDICIVFFVVLFSFRINSFSHKLSLEGMFFREYVLTNDNAGFWF